MKPGKKVVVLIVLLFICIGIKLYASATSLVESQYSTGFFSKLSEIQRYLFGWIPFSAGDILYAALAVWLLYKFSRIVLFFFRKKEQGAWRNKLKKNVYSLAVASCLLYIIFNLFWGINYNRKGIAWQLNLSGTKYSAGELKQLNGLLVQKVNAAKQSLVLSNQKYPEQQALFKRVTAAYKLVEQHYPFLQYRHQSIKESIWSTIGNYGGFTGYYNPFTGEAHVNTTVPPFIQPFTACHEVGHQLGYAKEDEANFVGYIAATASNDSLFHYSAYLEMFLYANRNLYFTDSTAAKNFSQTLSAPVAADIKEWILFNRKFISPAAPLFKILYGWFLRNNQQPQGMLSYDAVTGLLIAYFKEKGEIK